MLPFHLISHPELFEGEVHVLSEILERSDVFLHLRKPKLDEVAYEALVRALPEHLYPKIILHSGYHLAEVFDFGGVHFSTSKRGLLNSEALRCKASTSCHSMNEIKEVASEFEFCFLSPIFPSISKQGYSGDFDLDEVRAFLKKKRDCKIIALGGIDESRLSDVNSLGFEGFAVLGAVWGDSPKVGDDFVGIISRIKKRWNDLIV